MAAKDTSESREDRLKKALRDNLRRRKQAARREADPAPPEKKKPED